MKKTIFYLLLLLAFISCEKDAEITLGTFKCKIDGKTFYPNTTLYGMVHPVNVYYPSKTNTMYPAGFLSIQGIDANYIYDTAGDVVLQKVGVFGPGVYPLKHIFSTNPYANDGCWYYNSKESRNYFAESGELTITTFDTINKIIVGKFYIHVKDTLGNKKSITDGVFNTKYTN